MPVASFAKVNGRLVLGSPCRMMCTPGVAFGPHGRCPRTEVSRVRKARHLATVGTITQDREAQSLVDRSEEADVFVWTKNWYPIARLADLEESQGQGYASGVPEIQRQSILGQEIVLWKDSEGKWNAVEDRCAHRLAALSLGSVQEDGTLACRYHGWCFNGRGECTRIPQATDAAAEATACSSSRSQIQAYPTREAKGLLWVWPDRSATAWEDSAAQEPNVGWASDSNPIWLLVTDYPTSYETCIENVLDPTHLQYLHNGKTDYYDRKRFSPEDAIPITHFEQVGDMSAKGGFKLLHSWISEGGMRRDPGIDFTPPANIQWKSITPEGEKHSMEFQIVPLSPGRTRFFIGLSAFRKLPPLWGTGIRGKVMAAMWKFSNRIRNIILPSYVWTGLMHHNFAMENQDIAALHSEDVGLARTTGTFQNKYYLPTPSDGGVATFRIWLEKFSNGRLTWLNGGSEENDVEKLQNSELFDRWNRHSRWCPTCRKSLKFLARADSALSKAALIFVVLAVALIATRMTGPRLAVAATAAAGFALLGRFEMQQLRQRFLSDIPSTGIPEMSFEWPK